MVESNIHLPNPEFNLIESSLSHPRSHPSQFSYPQANAESGAVTLVSTLIAAVLMILALLFFTGAFYYIPMCVLAAVINISVLSMMDFQEMVNAYK